MNVKEFIVNKSYAALIECNVKNPGQVFMITRRVNTRTYFTLSPDVVRNSGPWGVLFPNNTLTLASGLRRNRVEEFLPKALTEVSGWSAGFSGGR